MSSRRLPWLRRCGSCGEGSDGGPLACALFFAVILLPTLGFVDYGYMRYSFVADRYQYLAGIGVIVFFAGAAAYGSYKMPDVLRKTAKGAALALLVLLGIAAWNQTAVYKDEVTLFRPLFLLTRRLILPTLILPTRCCTARVGRKRHLPPPALP